jgi:predicted unusual protein kinase regulating ubiquinone biosynthesis (AarF/ABC1/UbiB family)
VRHPNILDETYVDMDIIFTFVDTFLPSAYALPCSQDELTHILRQQLDLKWEAYNLYKFTSNFRTELKSGLINFPRVSRQLASDAVLIESWVDGATISTLFSELESESCGKGGMMMMIVMMRRGLVWAEPSVEGPGR